LIDGSRLYVANREDFGYCKSFNTKLLLSRGYTKGELADIKSDFTLALDPKHQALADGMKKAIYNSNDFTKDSIDSLKEYIKSALDCDLIITSGGVSVGDADFTKEAFSEFEHKILFDKVEIKPGKPTTFGFINDTAILQRGVGYWIFSL